MGQAESEPQSPGGEEAARPSASRQTPKSVHFASQDEVYMRTGSSAWDSVAGEGSGITFPARGAAPPLSSVAECPPHSAASLGDPASPGSSRRPAGPAQGPYPRSTPALGTAFSPVKGRPGTGAIPREYGDLRSGGVAAPFPEMRSPSRDLQDRSSSRSSSQSPGGAGGSSFLSGGRSPGALSPESVRSSGSASSRPADVSAELRQRNTWEAGSVVEVFSATLGNWQPALIKQVASEQMVRVCFAGSAGTQPILEKTLARSDLQLAAFGRNTACLPPGIKQVPSNSRPGQFSFLDTSSGMKFMSLELAWRHHIERLINPKVDPRSYAEPGPGTERIR